MIEKYKGKKVLVTGAAGFIGSHLVEELAQLGAEVTALVHYNSNSNINNLVFLPPKLMENIQITFGDITDSFQMDHLVKGKDVVFHLAALIGIPYSYVAPGAYVSANINGTLNMLEAARKNGIEKLVVTSTSETYGTAIYTPIDEKHPMQGQSPYSATKIGADKLAESYWLSFSLPVCIFRPFNTYGPRQSMRAVIPTIVTQILQSGDEVKLGSLSPIRDMVYVKDTVNGFLKSGISTTANGEVISVGTGHGVTIGEIVNMIQGLAGTNKRIIEDTQRIRPPKSEVFELICDNRKAKDLLGWEPEVTLQEGLENVIDFVRSNMNLFASKRYII